MAKAKVWTLADVQAMCIEEDDCWIWKGAIRPDGQPFGWMNGRVRLIRQWVYLTTKRIEKQPGMRVFGGCGKYGCVAAGCSEYVSYADSTRRMKRDKARDMLVQRQRNIDRGNAILNMEKAREIRRSDLPQRKLAEIYGVSQSAIRRIKANELWAEQVANSSVFNWRPAA